MNFALQELVVSSFFGVQDTLKNHSRVLRLCIFHQQLTIIDLDLKRAQDSKILQAGQGFIYAIFVIIQDRVFQPLLC